MSTLELFVVCAETGFLNTMNSVGTTESDLLTTGMAS